MTDVLLWYAVIYGKRHLLRALFDADVVHYPNVQRAIVHTEFTPSGQQFLPSDMDWRQYTPNYHIRLLKSTLTAPFNRSMCLLKTTEAVVSVANDTTLALPLLSCAVIQDHFECAGDLLNYGRCDIDALDSIGRTPLMYSILCRADTSYTQLILSSGQCDVNIAAADGCTALMLAVRHHKTRAFTISLLKTGRCDLNVRDKHGRTSLMHALLVANMDDTALLLETDGCDANARDSSGSTPLIFAASHRSQYCGFVESLVACERCDVNARDSNGLTALHWAVRNGYLETVRVLSACPRCDVNARDANGRTPLIWASRDGRLEIASLLIACHRCDVNATDSNGWSPIMHGYSYQGIVQQLKASSMFKINFIGARFCTQLSAAIHSEAYSVCAMLLTIHDCDVNLPDGQGRTPLILATSKCFDHASNGSHGSMWPDNASIAYRIVEMLLHNGAVDVNARDNRGRSALLIAAKNNALDVTELLLSSGNCEKDLQSYQGDTALSIAKLYGHKSIVEILEEQPLYDAAERSEHLVQGLQRLRLRTNSSQKRAIRHRLSVLE